MHDLITRRFAALAGLLATVAALATGELAAGLMSSWRSPVESVGLAVIDLVPGPVERWAISTLGTNDKPALIAGTVVILLLLGALLGILARTRLRLAAAGVVVLGLVGVAATARQADLLAGAPSVLTAVAGVGLLVGLLRAAPDARTGAADAGGGAGSSLTAADERRMRAGAGDRRKFLGLSGAVALASAAAVIGGRALTGRQQRAVEAARQQIAGQLGAPADPSGSATERALGVVDEPLPPLPDGVDFDIDGLAPFVTPQQDFYRIDTALTVPQIDPADWSLRIHGQVAEELEFSYEQLLQRDDLFEADITLTCVSNEVGGDLVSNARWTGVPLANLLDEAGVQDGADQVVGRSTDGWTAGMPTATVTDGRSAMLALLMNGEPLPAERGFPARIVVPGIYGYVSATKWLSEIELTSFEQFDQYWVERGWDARAPIKLQSRIDVPAPLERVPQGDIMVAGVAWAQGVGIERVEISLDDGEWQDTELAAEASVDTWRQWRWRWTAATPGAHRLTVRATDSDGNVQTDQRQPPFPNGATGRMTLLVTVTESA